MEDDGGREDVQENEDEEKKPPGCVTCIVASRWFPAGGFALRRWIIYIAYIYIPWEGGTLEVPLCTCSLYFI